MAIAGPDSPQYPPDATFCFLCSESFEHGEQVVYWVGAGTAIYLHGRCTASFVLRLARDAWALERTIYDRTRT